MRSESLRFNAVMYIALILLAPDFSRVAREGEAHLPPPLSSYHSGSYEAAVGTSTVFALWISA